MVLGAPGSEVPVLYDMPVSNNGARCRIIIYKKELTLGKDIAIAPPSVRVRARRKSLPCPPPSSSGRLCLASCTRDS
jgi:hypothetical protein